MSLVHLFISMIDLMLTFIVQHLLVIVILVAFAALVLATYVRRKPIRDAKKIERKTVRQYQRSYQKEAYKQAKIQRKNIIGLRDSCSRVIDMLNERINLESDPTELIWIRDQYNQLWQSLDRNEPVQQTPHDLLYYYLQNYNDTNSRLYSEMYELDQQYNDWINS